MTPCKSLFGSSLIVAMLCMPTWGQMALYSQPNTGSDGYFSDGAPGQFYNQRMADNFPLLNLSTVGGIRWWGHSEFFNSDDLTNMVSFQISVHVDAGGLPGPVLAGFPMNVPTAATNPTPSGRIVSGATEFVQLITFADMTFPAGNYWLSIGAILASPNGDAWAWSDSTVGDNQFAAQNPYGSPYVAYAGSNNDLAFEILIPEPAAGLLVLLTLAALRRRRCRG